MRKSGGQEDKMGRRFDVILLDVDGTLLDFNRSEALGIRRLLEHFGI